MEWPKISIVTPSYNQGKYLASTIESILSQNYPNLEYIIMDGGSQDESVDVIKKYSDRIYYWVSEKDKGQADAVCKGFQKATGEILGFVNSDDILAEGSLFKIAREFQGNISLDVLVGAGGMIDHDGHFLFGTYPLGWGTDILLSLQSRFMQPSVFYSKKIYDHVGGVNPQFRFCLDLDFFVRISLTQAKFSIIYDKLAFTRLHPETKTATWQHIAQKEIQSIYQKYNFCPSGLKWRMLNFIWRLKHFMLRCRFDGIRHVLNNRSRNIIEGQHADKG